MKEIHRAERRVEEFQTLLALAIKQAYPLGCRISVAKGEEEVIATVSGIPEGSQAGSLFAIPVITQVPITIYVTRDKPKRL